MKSVLDRAKENDTERKIMHFRAKQKESYEFKVRYAETRAWEFYRHPEIAGDCYVAVGGLDSITLLLFLRSIGIDVPAVSVSSLEDKSIQTIHKQLGVEALKPIKSKIEVIRMGNVDEPCRSTARRHLVRLGSCAGLHRRGMERSR